MPSVGSTPSLEIGANNRYPSLENHSVDAVNETHTKEVSRFHDEPE